MNEPPYHAPSYRHVAAVYDALASAYSLGAIDRAKSFHHRLVNADDRVLYTGAGRGGEVVGALCLGAEVTCVEPCPVMAMRLHERLSAEADDFTLMPKPIQLLNAETTYDLVVAHFFLNVFDPATTPSVLAHLCSFVKPGGRIIIADFKPASHDDGRASRFVRWLYYRPLNVVGWLLRICALHPIYDYAPLLIEKGFTIESRETFRVVLGLPGFYEVIVAKHF